MSKLLCPTGAVVTQDSTLVRLPDAGCQVIRSGIADWDRPLSKVRHGLHVITFVEPEWPKSNTEAWGGCSSLRR